VIVRLVGVQGLPLVVVGDRLVAGMTDREEIAIVGKVAIIAAGTEIAQSAVSSFLSLKLGLCLLRTECVLWRVKLRKLAGLTLCLRSPQ
jgi:hypothetical protein